MKRILLIADPIGKDQRVIDQAVALARGIDAELTVVGFVYEHIANLPMSANDRQQEVIDKLCETHRQAIAARLTKACGNGRPVKHSIEVHWEKRVAERVNDRAAKDQFDLVMKSARRSETFAYTPTDWQIMRGCRAPVLIVAGKRWKKSEHVMAAVDLGTTRRSKLELNHKVVAEASFLARALDRKLFVSYAVPMSRVLRDLDVIDESRLRAEGKRRLAAFHDSLIKRGIDVDGVRLVVGPPEKALVDAAAKSHAALVVIGCVGRKRLVGKVIGNTAEQILRLARADVLAIKP